MTASLAPVPAPMKRRRAGEQLVMLEPPAAIRKSEALFHSGEAGSPGTGVQFTRISAAHVLGCALMAKSTKLTPSSLHALRRALAKDEARVHSALKSGNG